MYRVAVMNNSFPLPLGIWPHLAGDSRFTVVQISHGCEAALEQLAKQPADLLMVDLRNHPDDGLELMRSLRIRDVNVDVIALIPEKDQCVVQQAFQLGAVDCVSEPSDAKRLQQALDRFVSRTGLSEAKGCLTQEAIDSILQGSSQPRNSLPKGLQETTLALVRKVLECSPESGLSCEDISSSVGLSRITVQRYLSYLCDRGELVRRVNYYTGGRPCMLYRRVTQRERAAELVRQIM